MRSVELFDKENRVQRDQNAAVMRCVEDGMVYYYKSRRAEKKKKRREKEGEGRRGPEGGRENPK